MDLSSLIQEFTEQVKSDIIEIYNEASIQYELAIFLRRARVASTDYPILILFQ